MIYQQAGTGAKGSNYAYWQTFEYMFVFAKGQPNSVNRIEDMRNKTIGLKGGGRFGSGDEKKHKTNVMGVRPNIWRYSVGFMDTSDKTEHPAPFPESLARDHILSWSKSGDLVFDPMLGSGTTGKMAVLTGRNFIGVELDEGYFQIAQSRIAKATQMAAGEFVTLAGKATDLDELPLFSNHD